ncbi:hypothetical protein ACFL6X_03065 [Candidatus Latescibacterota bacterium]
MRKTPLDQLERVARIYKSNADASRALGITTQAFGRLCRQHGIETPHSRYRSRRRRPSMLG